MLRLMRHAQLLAPSRRLPKAKNPHSGTIITQRPNEVWASDRPHAIQRKRLPTPWKKMLADGGARQKKASRLSYLEAFEERNL